MSLSMIFAIAALASAALLLQTNNRVWPTVAVVAAGLHLLIVTGIVRLGISGVPLSLVLGLALVISGALIWLKVTTKLHVSAATVIALVGALMAFSGFLEVR